MLLGVIGGRKYLRLIPATVVFILLCSLIVTKQTPAADVWSQLQQGSGYVVLLRHAIAPGVGDPDNFRLEDCATQRNLSAAGREQSQRLGAVFRRRNIKVARILSSQWCRCLDTARLMDLGVVEEFPALNSFFVQGDRQEQTAEVRQFIIAQRNTQGAIVMVTHQVNATALSGVFPQSGEAVILQANQTGNVERVGQISLSDYSD